MFPFTRRADEPPAPMPTPAPASTRPFVRPVTDPDATLAEMARHFECGNVEAAERHADSLNGWLSHEGWYPRSLNPAAVDELLTMVHQEAARQRAAAARVAALAERPTRADLLDALCQEICRLAAQARHEREMDLVIVLDALAEATTRGKLRAFAMRVSRVARKLGLP